MRPLVIRFITADSFISDAIRFVTFSHISHVEFGTIRGTWLGAHAGSGIEERPADYCKPTLEMVYNIPVPDLMYDAIMGDAFKAIGTKYDYKDILGLLIHANIKKPNPSPHAYECAMFVQNVCQRYGLRFLNVLPQYCNLVTPETLHLSPLFIGKRVKYFNAHENKTIVDVSK